MYVAVLCLFGNNMERIFIETFCFVKEVQPKKNIGCVKHIYEIAVAFCMI